MARGDGIFARVDVDVWTKPRVMRLRPVGAKAFYLMAWTYAVKERNEQIPDSVLTQLAKGFLDVCNRTARLYTKKCIDAGLFEDLGDGMIRVVKCRACHKKMKWPEDEGAFDDEEDGGSCGENGFPRIPPERVGTKTKIKRKRYNTEPETKEGTTTGRNSAVSGSGVQDEKGGKGLEHVGDIAGRLADSYGRAVSETNPDKVEETANDIMLSLKLPEKERLACMKIAERYDMTLVYRAMTYVRDRIDAGENRDSKLTPVRNRMALMNSTLERIRKGGKE